MTPTPSSPSVTVVIPTIGRPSVIEAVASALSQRGVEVEVVVVDDSGNEKVPHSTDPRVTVLRTSGREGAAAARQLGAVAASRDLVALLDDDDLYLPGHLRQASSYLDQHPDHVYACRALVRYPQRARIEPVVLAEDTTASEYLFGRDVWRSRRRRIITSTIVVPRRFADFPLHTPQAIGEDTAWLLSAEVAGARMHVGAYCGVLIDAAPGRDAARVSDRDSYRIHEDLDAFPRTVSASAYLGRLGRDAARAGRPLDVVRAVQAGVRQDNRPVWWGVGAAELAVASVIAAGRAVRRG